MSGETKEENSGTPSIAYSEGTLTYIIFGATGVLSNETDITGKRHRENPDRFFLGFFLFF